MASTSGHAGALNVGAKGLKEVNSAARFVEPVLHTLRAVPSTEVPGDPTGALPNQDLLPRH